MTPFTGTAVLEYETRDRKAWITLNRPHAMNAFDDELAGSLIEAFTAFSADDELLVAILTGAGGRAFSAGADLKQVASRQAARAPRSPAPAIRQGGVSGVFHPGQGSHFDAVDECQKPVIAAIDGYCLAGGFEVALCCDIRIATRTSTFGLPEPRRSMLGGPALVTLSRMIPFGEALRWQLTGASMSAERAHQVGLIAEVCADRGELMVRAEAIADEILECAPLAVQYIKQVVKAGRSLGIAETARYAEMFHHAISTTDDMLEGPRAFAEKRRPSWKGR